MNGGLLIFVNIKATMKEEIFLFNILGFIFLLIHSFFGHTNIALSYFDTIIINLSKVTGILNANCFTYIGVLNLFIKSLSMSFKLNYNLR